MLVFIELRAGQRSKLLATSSSSINTDATSDNSQQNNLAIEIQDAFPAAQILMGYFKRAPRFFIDYLMYAIRSMEFKMFACARSRRDARDAHGLSWRSSKAALRRYTRMMRVAWIYFRSWEKSERKYGISDLSLNIRIIAWTKLTSTIQNEIRPLFEVKGMLFSPILIPLFVNNGLFIPFCKRPIASGR